MFSVFETWAWNSLVCLGDDMNIHSELLQLGGHFIIYAGGILVIEPSLDR